MVHSAQFEAENVVLGSRLRHVAQAVFKSVSGEVVAPSSQQWWKTSGDGGGERQSQRFLPSAVWFEARCRTWRAWARFHPEEVLYPWKTRKGNRTLVKRQATKRWREIMSNQIIIYKQYLKMNFSVDLSHVKKLNRAATPVDKVGKEKKYNNMWLVMGHCVPPAAWNL